MFHVSKTKLDKIKPKIPENNFYIKLGIENDFIKRICCSDSIDNCLKGLANTIKENNELYVYKIKSDNIFKNKEIILKKLVPFAKYTK